MSEKTNNKLRELPKKINNHLRDTYKHKCRVAAMSLVFISLIFFLTMLIGSMNGSVFLSKFTFSDPVSHILNRKSITFTFLGFCVDDQCTQQVSHNFDKAPTSQEITSGQVQKRGINIDPSGIGNSIGNTAQDAGKTISNTAQDAGKSIGNTAQDAGNAINTAGQAAANATTGVITEVSKLGQELAQELLKAFDNFVPKEPTNGKSGWIARPIITASIFNSLALVLLLITNTENRKYCYPSAFILLLISFILNLVSFLITFSLFGLVFDVIGVFPGIGGNQTGPAMTLSGFSCLFLLISLGLIIIDGSKKVKHFK